MKTSQSIGTSRQSILRLPKMSTNKVVTIILSVLAVVVIVLASIEIESNQKQMLLRSKTKVELVAHRPKTIEIILPAAEENGVHVLEKRYLINTQNIRNIEYKTSSKFGSSLAIQYGTSRCCSKTLNIYNLTFDQWNETVRTLGETK